MPNARRPTALLPFVLTAILASCAGGRSEAGRPAPTAADRIELARGPCFGACPIYSLTVWGDGRVRFVGERFVEETGERTRTIDPLQAVALFAHADSIGFFAMPADITPANEAACGGAWTDMPSAQVTVRWADRDHAVNDYHGCPKAPASLRAFEQRIDAVAGVADWVGQR